MQQFQTCGRARGTDDIRKGYVAPSISHWHWHQAVEHCLREPAHDYYVMSKSVDNRREDFRTLKMYVK